MLVGGQTEAGAGGVGKLGATFAMALGGALHFRDALSDDGLGDDQLRAAGLGLLGLVDRLGDGDDVVTVGERLDVPADGLEAGGDVFALRLVGRGIERDVVRIVNEDQVVELLVAGEGDGFQCDAFLHATVTGEGDDMVVEDRMLGGVEAGLGHFAGEGETDGVGDTLDERASRALDAGRLMKLRVAGSLGVQLAEVLHLIDREVVAAKVQPAVQEHRAVAGGEHEAVAVEPAGLGGIVREGVAVKGRADLGRAEREAQMPGRALVDGINGEATGLVGGLGKEFWLQFHE